MTAMTREERLARGKSLRRQAPRHAHAEWQPAFDRADPLRVLADSDRGRLAELLPIRYGRMLPSPFTFFRGAACIMAADLASTPASGLRAQICGDAHLANFGGFATPERRIVFDINDFDETLPAPWEWDVKRLVTSIIIAGVDRRLSPEDTRLAATATAAAYRDRMWVIAALPILEAWYHRMDAERLLAELGRPRGQRLLGRKIARAATHDVLDTSLITNANGHGPVIKDAPPLVFHPPGPLGRGLERTARAALVRYRASLRPEYAALASRYRLVDIAMKVVGVGSVGTRCAILLLTAGRGDLLILQAKEARASVLEPYAGRSEFAHHGQRVVLGQRQMQTASDIFLGWTTVRGRAYYLRQLRDGKIKVPIDQFDARALTYYGIACGWALAAAHARTGDAAQIAGYIGRSYRFVDSIVGFAERYANQNERDYTTFATAVRRGQIQVEMQTPA